MRTEATLQGGKTLVLLPVPERARFADLGYFVWCGSMTRGGDGRCYLFYSRWPQSEGFNAWATHSEIAVAVADDPLGPYLPLRTVLGRRAKGFWDSDVTHNPTVRKFGSLFYLYYMGNFGDGTFWNHRNHQRIGVAVASAPEGPWKRSDAPLVDVTPGGFDHLMTSNPSVCQRPGGDYLLVYKGVGDGEMPFGGTVSHGVAVAANPAGPFVKRSQPVFGKPGEKFAAEDPFIWRDGNRFRAVVKDMKGVFTGAGTSLALFESPDSVSWRPAPEPLLSGLQISWEKGGVQRVQRLERPQIYLEEGRPRVLFCAVKESDTVTYSVAIPLQVQAVTEKAAAKNP